MTKSLLTWAESYNLAHEQAIFVDRSQLGLLKFTGQTRQDLLHRMSTNDINRLKLGEGCATILTTDIGRIIDRLRLYATHQAVYALTSENNADAIAQYLMRFVFFNDDFHIEDLSANSAIFAVYGKNAPHLLGNLVGTQNVETPLHHWRRVTIDDIVYYVHHTDPVAGNGYFIVCERQHQQIIREALQNAGIHPAPIEAFNYLRIESQLPLLGRELTPDYIPLEANLWDDVSFHKGCYIGQEIIARMDSRGKLAKKLHLMQLSGMVEPATPLMMGSRNAGIITSLADGPQGVLALGYIKTSALEKGEPLSAGEYTVTLL